ncbi:MFS general substrate transporter, partial [Aureobasidium melanogenum]
MVENTEADFDHVPGTVHLVDVVGRASSSARHDASQEDIVLIPQPSANPEDPLNWAHHRKLFAVGMALLYVLGTGIATSLQYSVLANITDDTGISTDNLVQGTGIMFLFFGWACLFWQPIALTYGRRGVYLITMFLTIPIMAWTAYSSSAGEWFAHRVLIGIVVSPIESLCEVTVFDLFFAHNRGTYMGIYVFTLFGSNFLAPLVAGWFNDAYGWRWTMNLGTIICGVVFIVMFFSMEETIYFRHSTLEGISIEMDGTNTYAAGPKSLTQAKSELKVALEQIQSVSTIAWATE